MTKSSVEFEKIYKEFEVKYRICPVSDRLSETFEVCRLYSFLRVYMTLLRAFIVAVKFSKFE